MSAVQLRDVTVRYGSRVALRSTTCQAEEGEFVCLVGMNGSGKSTLLKAIVGAVNAGGEVSVLGTTDRSRRRLVGYVPQRESINWDFPVSVLDVVMMGRLSTLRRIGPDSEDDRQAAYDALAAVQMETLQSRGIGELSGGQQQRVILARALYSKARVLLLDEPLGGVDPATREVVLGVLRGYCSSGGTVLMASHDVVETARAADRAWGLNGTVVADVAAPDLLGEDVLRAIYGEALMVLTDGRRALGDQAR